MHPARTVVLASVFLSISVPAHAGLLDWFGPSNYDDCVLQALKDAGNSALALRMAEKACRSKFSDTAPKPPAEPAKTKCGDNYYQSSDYSSDGLWFENPFRSLFSAEITEIVVEDRYPLSNAIVVYVRHNYPFALHTLKLDAWKNKESAGKPDWTYVCTGGALPDVTSEFVCGETKTPDSWYRIQSIKSQYGNTLDLLRAARVC